LGGIVLLFACSLPVIAGCYREVRTVKQMTWECEPAWDRHNYPEVQSVRFRYIDAPRYSELVPGRHLCDDLRASGKPVVLVEFVVFGDPWDGVRGTRISAIDGRPYASGGGFGSSRVEGLRPGEQAKSPFDGLIPTHRLY
jgi:hypothetical protein